MCFIQVYVVGSIILDLFFYFEPMRVIPKVNIDFCAWNISQAAFLSALAGVDVAEAAAQAAVTSLSQVGRGANKEPQGSLAKITKLQGIQKFLFGAALRHLGFGLTYFTAYGLELCLGCY